MTTEKEAGILIEKIKITLILEEKTYNGIILKQWDNGLKKKLYLLLSLSSETGVTIWGSKLWTVRGGSNLMMTREIDDFVLIFLFLISTLNLCVRLSNEY